MSDKIFKIISKSKHEGIFLQGSDFLDFRGIHFWSQSMFVGIRGMEEEADSGDCSIDEE